MNTSINKHDALEQLIYNEDIKIQSIDVHTDMDMFLIILNTGSVLKEKISKHSRLSKADKQTLLNYELIGNGTGIHWPELDEDLSLKGLLKDAIKEQVMGNKVA